MLHHPCILGDPQRHGEQNQNWWGPQVGGNATSPLHSRESPKTRGTKSELLSPKMSGNATSPLHSRGSPKTWVTKSELVGPTSGWKCYITPAFSRIPKDMEDKIRIGGAHKWAEMLHHPCILGDPQRHGGRNQIWWGPQVGRNATSPLHSRGSARTWGTKSELVGPTSGRKCYITPAFSGIPSKTWGTKSELVGPTSWRKCYITPAFSGIPKDMGDKIRIGGAHKWAEMLHHPSILGGPQEHGEQNQNWWGPQVGGNATSPLYSRGSPQRHGEQNQIWWGPQVGGNATSPLHPRGSPKTWGTKSELVGPTSERKCYISPVFSGIPKDMGNKIRFGGAHKWAEL